MAQESKKVRYPTITQAELAGGYFSKYVTFVISTPDGATIKRRYTDFEWLRGWLVSHYPGAFIPPIPDKLPVAMWPTGYLLDRKRELQQFLQRIQIIKYLEKEEIVKFFLKYHNDNFDKARKQWDNDNKKPSPRAIYDNLSSKFPTVAKQPIPETMDELNVESRDVVNKIMQHLTSMKDAAHNFIKHSETVELSMTEFRSAFSRLAEIENYGVDKPLQSNKKYCAKVRVPAARNLVQWTQYTHDEIDIMRLTILPTLKRCYFDTKVIQQLIAQRDKLIQEYEEAQLVAKKWESTEARDNLRSTQIAAKHRDLGRQEDLKLLSEFVNKMVLDQMSIVWEANLRRWERCTNTFIGKHSNILEKLYAAWSDLVTLADADTGILVRSLHTSPKHDLEEKTEEPHIPIHVGERLSEEAIIVLPKGASKPEEPEQVQAVIEPVEEEPKETDEGPDEPQEEEPKETDEGPDEPQEEAVKPPEPEPEPEPEQKDEPADEPQDEPKPEEEPKEESEDIFPVEKQDEPEEQEAVEEAKPEEVKPEEPKPEGRIQRAPSKPPSGLFDDTDDDDDPTKLEAMEDNKNTGGLFDDAIDDEEL